MGVAKTDQLGTNERIQEKIEKIKQFAREAPAVSSARGDGAEVQGLRDALRASQRRERELHQRIEVILLRFKPMIGPLFRCHTLFLKCDGFP